MILEYEYEICIRYDLLKIVGQISGVGGRVLLENTSALPSFDFGPSRVIFTNQRSDANTGKRSLLKTLETWASIS
jgi:hypothetical protein